jgi:hypothetical protein
MHMSHTSGVARRRNAAILGLFCVAMGLLAIAMTVRQYDADRRAKSAWLPTACLIQEARARTQIFGNSGQVFF